MMSTQHAKSFLPLALKVLKGESIELSEAQASAQKKADMPTLVGIGMQYEDDEEKEYDGERGGEPYSKGLVKVIPIKGAITKENPPCSYGLQTKINWLKEAEQDARISAVVLDIDSPGGDARFLETFTNQIKSMTKPVIAQVNGLAASAAYWIASACDEIYATERGDMIGSIGVMVTVVDWESMYKKEGIKIHEIYASQSSAKNETYRAATEGDYSPMRERLLDPLADDFIEHVRQHRTVTDEMAFAGRVYMSGEALSIGLIDGIKSFDEIVTRAFELSSENIQQKMVISKKTHPAVLAVLGHEQMESQDEQVTLRLDELNQLEETLASNDAKVANERAEQLEKKVNALEQANAELTEQKSNLETKLEEWAQAPAANTRGEIPGSDTEVELEEYKSGADADRYVIGE